MALIGAALAGIALGFVGVWLALWLPMAIEQEEAAWVAKAQGTTPAESPTVTVQRIRQALVASKLQMTVFVAITMLACLWIVHSAGWTPKSGVLILLAAALVSLALRPARACEGPRLRGDAVQAAAMVSEWRIDPLFPQSARRHLSHWII